jgi:hypothetical protein
MYFFLKWFPIDVANAKIEAVCPDGKLLKPTLQFANVSK